MTEDNLSHIRQQLDAIQKSITAIEISQGISTSLQQRYDLALREVESCLKGKISRDDAIKAQTKIEHDIDALQDRYESGRRYISQYESDRKAALAIIATVTCILGAINGLVVKITTNYFTELETKIEKTELASKQRYEQYLFDSTKNANDISNLRDKLVEIHKGQK